MTIEERFPGLYSSASGSLTTPGTRVHRAVFSDSVDQPFRCRYFKCSASGVLKVTTANGESVAIVVVEGYNAERIDRIWATGSDAIDVDLWD